MKRKLTLPEFGLVLLMGPENPGWAGFAAKNFAANEVFHLQMFQDMTGEVGAALSEDAVQALFNIVEIRLRKRLRTVVMGLGQHASQQKRLVHFAKKWHAGITAWFYLPHPADFKDLLPKEQLDIFAKTIAEHGQEAQLMQQEGIKEQLHWDDLAQLDACEVETLPMPSDQRGYHGGLDIIGGIHGCLDEFLLLLDKLGYTRMPGGVPQPPKGRKLLLLGDVADIGPKGKEVLEILLPMAEEGNLFAVLGNQDRVLAQSLHGKAEDNLDVLGPLLASLDSMEAAFKARLWAFLDSLPTHLVLDGGKLVAVHAGIKPEFLLRNGGPINSFCAFGETPGERALVGHLVPSNWTSLFDDMPVKVVHAHQAIHRAKWQGNSLNLDTGCVYGGSLSALQYPEMLQVSVPSKMQYAAADIAKVEADDLGLVEAHGKNRVDWEKIDGTYLVQSKFRYNFSIAPNEADWAMHHFAFHAVDPRWIIYLPSKMSPPQAAKQQGYLEHLEEGFSYFEKKGLNEVWVQEKITGQHVVVVVCKSAAVAEQRFGVKDELGGTIYDRYGRPVDLPEGNTGSWLEIIREAATVANVWENLKTDWVCLEGIFNLEPLPAKFEYHEQEIAASQHEARYLVEFLEGAGAEASQLLGNAKEILELQPSMTQGTFQRLVFHPLHIVATEGQNQTQKELDWHTEILAQMAAASHGKLALPKTMHVELTNFATRTAAINWFEHLSKLGEAGVIVKAGRPVFLQQDDPIQAAIKVRGKEALRKIYGVAYTAAESLDHYKRRSLKDRRELIVREVVLGQDSLDAFLANGTFEAIHQSIFIHFAIVGRDTDPRL